MILIHVIYWYWLKKNTGRGNGTKPNTRQPSTEVWNLSASRTWNHRRTTTWQHWRVWSNQAVKIKGTKCSETNNQSSTPPPKNNIIAARISKILTINHWIAIEISTKYIFVTARPKMHQKNERVVDKTIIVYIEIKTHWERHLHLNIYIVDIYESINMNEKKNACDREKKKNNNR